MEKISIVTCAYRHGHYLESTLRSVLDQNYPALEYIVIDGGSKDNSVEILKKYESRLSYWVSEPDKGQTDALIKGFKRSTGQIMGWVCSDDLLLPGCLERIDRFFTDHPEIDAVYGDALWIDQQGNFIRPKKEIGFSRFVFLYDHNYIPQPSMFWRRSLYERVGGLNPSFNLAMDSDLWDRFSRVTEIAYMPHYLSCMRFYQQQKMHSMRLQADKEDAVIRRRDQAAIFQYLYPLLHIGARVTRITRKTLSGGYRRNISDDYLAWLQRYVTGETGR